MVEGKRRQCNISKGMTKASELVGKNKKGRGRKKDGSRGEGKGLLPPLHEPFFFFFLTIRFRESQDSALRDNHYEKASRI
jgi:hypothetical protein